MGVRDSRPRSIAREVADWVRTGLQTDGSSQNVTMRAKRVSTYGGP
ncbi:hypothetical protein [Natrinema soli]|uniref:Uncharacterized protein n=1 Tax=Natrinema soli TaxID=1930624 RepID=A0ABD5SFU6_9EURY|nr:hypothetical protein [Natrinema soli]